MEWKQEADNIGIWRKCIPTETAVMKRPLLVIFITFALLSLHYANMYSQPHNQNYTLICAPNAFNDPKMIRQKQEPPIRTMLIHKDIGEAKHFNHKEIDPSEYTPPPDSNVVIPIGTTNHSHPTFRHLHINDSVVSQNVNWIEIIGEDKLENYVSHVNTATRNTIQLEPLPYLPNFHNPCWIERLPTDLEPYSLQTHQFEMNKFNAGKFRTLQSQFSKRKEKGTPYRMRCLPLFYIIGPQKCGTTDLHESLGEHPAVVNGLFKEPHWWTRSRLVNTTLEEYSDLFDLAAENIASNGYKFNGSVLHPYITGEASAELIWDNWSWMEQPENRQDGHSPQPRYLAAHHIHHVTPQAKIIAMLRNPVTRLWSDYNYWTHKWKKSSEDFHRRIQKGLLWLASCFKNIKTRDDRRHCMYDRVAKYGQQYGADWNPVVRTRIGVYSEFLADWFDIFPREQILILKMEDYAKDRVSVLNQIFRFLDLDDIPKEIALSLQTKSAQNAGPNTKQKQPPQMKDETVRQLKIFYEPFNKKLVEMTGNSEFMEWNF